MLQKVAIDSVEIGMYVEQIESQRTRTRMKSLASSASKKPSKTSEAKALNMFTSTQIKSPLRKTFNTMQRQSESIPPSKETVNSG